MLVRLTGHSVSLSLHMTVFIMMTYVRGMYMTMYALYVDLLQLFPTYYVGVWRECSVRGGIYSLRETRSIPSKSQKVDAECNILQDGTLIDLCGATLVWRSRTGQYLPVAAVPFPNPANGTS